MDKRLSDILAEQIAYYDARASDWNGYGGRGGPYADAASNSIWFSDLRIMHDEVRALPPSGNVLELAAGTGLWSVELAKHARKLTVLDASSRMLVINRQRCDPICKALGIPYRSVCSNMFEWEPDALFDFVFFSFFLCHVPPALFDEFWRTIRRYLRPDGRFLFFDSCSRNGSQFENVDFVTTRTLADGRTFRVVKVRYPVRILQNRLRELGFVASVNHCGRRGLIGSGGVAPQNRF